MDVMDISLKDIDWGKDESKDDINLPNYFLEHNEFPKVLKGEKSVKEITSQKLAIKTDSDNMKLCVDIYVLDE